MSINCNYPNCKKTFKVNCPIQEIYDHLQQEHDIGIFDFRSLFSAALYIQTSPINLTHEKEK
jgi:hypothetical protein